MDGRIVGIWVSEGVAGPPTQLAGLDEEKYIQGYSRALTGHMGQLPHVLSSWRRGGCRLSVEMAAVSGRRGENVHTHLLPGGDVVLDIVRELPKDL